MRASAMVASAFLVDLLALGAGLTVRAEEGEIVGASVESPGRFFRQYWAEKESTDA